jgi:DNA polymerase-3 subunit alpha (Gram-positive type)
MPSACIKGVETMPGQYVLKPDNKSLKAFKGIEEVSFSFPIAPVLEEGLISEILVDTQASAWKISLFLKEKLNPEAIAELETVLSGLVLGLSRVELKVISPDNLPSLDERLSTCWYRIITYANEKFAGCNGWLTEAKYRLVGRNLEIEVRNQAGVDYLTRRRDELQEIIKEFIWEDLNVGFAVGDYNEEILEAELRKEQETAEFIQSMAKTVKAAKPEPALNGKTPENTEVIYGRKITAEPSPIRELTDEIDQVVIRGEIFRFESRVSKAGKKFFMGDITDYGDSISFKIFPRKEEPLEERLSEGKWVFMKGNVQFDPYAKEFALLVSDIAPAPPGLVREDNAAEKRVELHLHTKMSAMDATAEASAAVKLAAKLGHAAVAITDHGVVHSFPEVAATAKKAGIKAIYGVEGYLVDDGALIVTGADTRKIKETVFVVFDIETTGFNPWKEDLLEIGAVKVRDGKVIDEFKTLIKPGKPISGEIQKLTGITPEMVQDSPLPEAVLPEFLTFIEGAVVVAHNARFDVGFIKGKLQQYFDREFNPVALDTLGLSRAVWPGLRSHRLNNVAKELGISLEHHHRAVDDARCAATIMQKALEKIKDRHYELLSDLNLLIKDIGVEHLRTYHIIILVKTQAGMKNLYRLVSDSHIKYFHRHPRIPRSLLTELREGLILGTACEAGEFYQAILDGADEAKLMEIAGFYDFLEIQPLTNNQFLIDSGRVKSREELQGYNRLICDLGAKLGKPVVATGDVHFLHPHEAVYRKILMMGQGFEDADKETPLYFRTTAEMLGEFDYLGAELAEEVVIKNPRLIAEQIGNLSPVPNEFCPPQIPGAEEEIRNMSYEHARVLYGDPLPQLVQDRLEWELKSIIDHGYAVLYLTAHKLVKKSLDDGYLVGSRGSVGSSFVATMCNITEVNPLPGHYRCPECKYSEFKETGAIASGYDLPDKNCPRCGHSLIKDGQDIPFATFMGFEGDKEPDIDLNFSGDYQPKVHRYTEELFGKGYVYRAGTVTGLAEKMAFGFVRGYMEDKGIKLRQAETNRLVKGCTGVRRSTGQHPGGLYVVPKDHEIYDFTPIQYPANDKKADWITTHYDYHGALEGRLVKLDILGHDDPTVIRMLHDLTGIDPRTVPMAEPETMKIFSSIEPLGIKPEDMGFDLGTLGIPEFGTGFVRQMLEETLPTTFAELVFISGLSHGTSVWLGNAQELIRNHTAKLSEVISTRDDIMNYLIFKGLPPKTSFKIMEKVRKGKGLEAEEVEIMKAHDVPDWYIDSCLKIKYMFPKAHAVAYVMMAFRIAYFKVNHPEAYYCTYFTVRADEFDADIVVQGLDAVKKTREEIRFKGNEATQKEKNLDTILELVVEAMLRGINFLHVDIYRSHPYRFVITPEGLLPPLASLQGMGENAANSLAAARENGPFISIEDLKTRARISSAVIEVLQKHGCLEGLPEKDQLTLF